MFYKESKTSHNYMVGFCNIKTVITSYGIYGYFLYNYYMKKIQTKIITGVLLFTGLFIGSQAYAQPSESQLRAQMIDVLTELIAKLKEQVLLEEQGVTESNTHESETESTKMVDGYHMIGSDNEYAKVTFNIPVRAAGDSDLEFDGYDAFIFEIDGDEYSATELNDGVTLPGYQVTIEDGDDDVITSGYILRDGQSETFTIKIILDVNETNTGTGEYEIELDSIVYLDIESGRTDELKTNLDSDPIDLLA